MPLTYAEDALFLQRLADLREIEGVNRFRVRVLLTTDDQFNNITCTVAILIEPSRLEKR